MMSIYIIIVTTYRVYKKLLKSKCMKSTFPKFPSLKKKTWHFALESCCIVPDLNPGLQFLMLQFNIFYCLCTLKLSFGSSQTLVLSVSAGRAEKNNLVWFSHRSAGERSAPLNPQLWHSDYVGTVPSRTPPTSVPRALGV